jgi:hypothetical protein
LPEMAGLPPFISSSTSYPELGALSCATVASPHAFELPPHPADLSATVPGATRSEAREVNGGTRLHDNLGFWALVFETPIELLLV